MQSDKPQTTTKRVINPGFDGMDARRAGLPVDACPYEPSPQRTAWVVGWYIAAPEKDAESDMSKPETTQATGPVAAPAPPQPYRASWRFFALIVPTLAVFCISIWADDLMARVIAGSLALGWIFGLIAGEAYTLKERHIQARYEEWLAALAASRVEGEKE